MVQSTIIPEAKRTNSNMVRYQPCAQFFILILCWWYCGFAQYDINSGDIIHQQKLSVTHNDAFEPAPVIVCPGEVVEFNRTSLSVF